MAAMPGTRAGSLPVSFLFVKSGCRIRCLQLQEAFKLRLQPSQVVGVALAVDQPNKQMNQAFVI